MNFNTKIPIYVQICEYIKKEIIIGNLSPNEKIPSVRELAAKLNVNPNTVQRVFRELESENIILSKRGMGSYITDNEDIMETLKIQMADEIISEFIDNMWSIGFKSSDIIEKISGRLEYDKNTYVIKKIW